MANQTLLGSWIRRFLQEHLVAERNLARNTQRSYRDTIILFVSFAISKVRKAADRLTIDDITPDLVRLFLVDLEETRLCSITTRNQRLAAIHSFAGFVGSRSPEYIAWSGTIRAVPFKKAGKLMMPYLDKSEMNALLAAPDTKTAQGCRDYALLLFLYNSGARASEAAQVRPADLTLLPSASVLIHGKGGRDRVCPLWPSTSDQLRLLVSTRGVPPDRVFRNRCGHPITRFGIHTLVERYVLRAAVQMPSLGTKRVSPHTIRHTTAMHLLRAGVDINTIRAWLGHVSIDTTNIYAEADLEMKAKALAKCEILAEQKTPKPWRLDKDLMAFLHTL